MKTRLIALGLLAAISTAQADMVSGALKFYPTANGFGVRSYANNTQPLNDPYVDLTVKVAKSKSLTSIFRFERALSIDRITVPYQAALYVVPKGAVITKDTLAKRGYKLIGATDGSKPSTALVGRDFWLVVDTSTSGSAPHTVVSWAHVRFNASGTPEMIDHISAYDEPGIVVGQITPCTVCQP
jgi:hypothetical protein